MRLCEAAGLRLNNSFVTKLVCALALATAPLVSVQAEDWPHWRGPDRNGISKEKGWTDKFPGQGARIAWKANVGLGFSSIVVGKGKAYTAGHAQGTDTVFCLDAVSGKELWKQSYPADLGDLYYEGGTTGTPTLDGDRLYWLSRWGDLFCYEAATGKIVWNRQLVKETEVNIPKWGFTGAPTIHKNLLILNVGDRGMALDKASGKQVWASGKGDAGYSTPLLIERSGQTEAWFANAEEYFSVAADTGKPIWGMRWVTQYGVNAADPIPYQDKVFISTGYGKGAALFKPSASSDSEPEVLWKNRVLRTQLNAAILVDKYLYGVDGDTVDKAQLKCIQIESGKQLWSEAGFGNGGLVIADGKIIALSAIGELMIAPVSPESFKPSARAQVLGGKSWTAPVLANGIVYCRNSRGDIAAVDLRAK